MNSNRRKFLKTLAATGAAAAFPGTSWLNLAAATDPNRAGSFDFVFFTDTHIQPELDAAHGCTMAFAKIAAGKPDFAICGGDLVYDVMSEGRHRANMLFDLYQRTEDCLKMPLHHTIVLDSILPTPDRLWEARVDDAQLHWLSDDLRRIEPHAPVIVITHVPLI